MSTSPLAALLSLTRAMLDAAGRAEWETVEQLHAQRQPLLLADLFTHSDAPELLPQLDALQKELTALMVAAQSEMRKSMLEAQRGYAGVSAYLSAAHD